MSLNGMQPFYFGPPERRLFGVYSGPKADSDVGAAVVLCNPSGHDYMYAFRPLRTLAIRLERAGLHTLRFDYLGTGDSAGDFSDASPRQWIDDVGAAVAEIRSRLPSSSISLVGFRLGATLAAIAANEFDGIGRLVLWEPVIQGSDYAASLHKCHQEWFETLRRALPRSRLVAAEDELLGTRVSETFQTDLERLNLWALDACPARRVLIVGSEGHAECARLAGKFQELGARVDVRMVDQGPKIPAMLPGMPAGLVPNGVVIDIVKWFGSDGDD